MSLSPAKENEAGDDVKLASCKEKIKSNKSRSTGSRIMNKKCSGKSKRGGCRKSEKGGSSSSSAPKSKGRVRLHVYVM